jgi:hypothetical protein
MVTYYRVSQVLTAFIVRKKGQRQQIFSQDDGNLLPGSTVSQSRIKIYEGCSESKERLRIQPAQLFHCTRAVIWCVQ